VLQEIGPVILGSGISRVKISEKPDLTIPSHFTIANSIANPLSLLKNYGDKTSIKEICECLCYMA
jgi:hypothetical protein